MSTYADNGTACANISDKPCKSVEDEVNKNEGCKKRVNFPETKLLVTEYFEPANPWQNVPSTNRSQLAAEYLEACRRHNTHPIETVLQQIRELPEACIGGSVRATRLALADCSLIGVAPADALEAVFRKVQFRRLEIDHAEIDDEGAEAIFDMIEYYESACSVLIAGPRQFGIRGWQAASRMIKKSANLSELEISESTLEPVHAVVLARSLRACSCRLRALALQQARLAGEPLHTLLLALKSNTSVLELRLCDNELSSADAVQIASLLRANNTLQLLDLSNNHIMDEGVTHIASALVEQAALSPPSAAASPSDMHNTYVSGHEVRGLAFLVLWNNNLTKNCAYDISRAVSASRSLCVLNVGRNHVGSSLVYALGSVRCNVAMLGLQGTGLRPDAATLLGALASNDSIQRLDLRDNKLGEAGLQALLAAAKQNKTLTQIDLDVPTDTSSLLPSDNTTATMSRLVREIQDTCSMRASAADTHRRISLTCHTAHCQNKCNRPLECRSRLRSPAPSPASSPIPTPSRFTVSRVTPERESSTDSSSPSTPTSNTPSRFRVVQVTEPPKVHEKPSIISTPRKSNSRFSVTRNYDSVYNTALTPSPPPIETTVSETDVKDKCSTVTLTDVDVKDKQGSDTTLVDDNEFKRQTSEVKLQTSELKRQTSKVKRQTNEVKLQISEVIRQISDGASVKTPVAVSGIKEAEKPVAVNLTAVKSDVKEDGSAFKDKTEVIESDVSVIVIGDKSETKVNSVVEDVGIEMTVKKTGTDKISDAKCADSLVKDKKDDEAMKQIAAITEDLGNLIQQMKVLSDKTAVLKKAEVKVKSDSTQTESEKVPVAIQDSVVLKKNKSESSLDSPDLEVSRLMNKKLFGSPFCDSSSSLEVSESSMESLNDNQPIKPVKTPKTGDSDSELDRRKPNVPLSTESSIESSISEVTPVNSCGNFLNTSISSTDSVSPVNFGRNVKIHGSLSSLEASVSSLDSCKPERVMVTSTDSGIEYSLQNTSDMNDSSNEGTLTNNSSLKESVKKDSLHDTLTSPKRTSSLLDVPMKAKSLDRMRKISWVAPSSSFHIPRPEPEKVESKLPSHLEKLLSLFQHPSSIFSRGSEDEKKSSSGTPPRKDSTLTSSFWSWGALTVEKEDEGSSPDVTDSTLSERIQVSFVDESFSKKLDSKTPSTDTDNTLSEFQSLPIQNSECDIEKVTTESVQIGLSYIDSNPVTGCDNIDLINPNDLNNDNREKELVDNMEPEPVRPKSFAAVLKASASENQEKHLSPDSGQSIDKLPSKIVRGIKENVSPENTLTSSMTNTKALTEEFTEREVKSTVVATIWDITQPSMAKISFKSDEVKVQSDLAPIANIDETCDEAIDNIIDIKTLDVKAKSLEEKVLGNIDLGKDALSYLMYEHQDFEPGNAGIDTEAKPQTESLAQELKEAELKEKLIDLSPELVVDEKEVAEIKYKSVLPVKLQKSNSLEDISIEKKESPKLKTIAFKIPESTTPRDIPERRRKIRSRSGTSPKSLPESLNKPCPLSKMDSVLNKKKKKVSSLGKMARDSLLALNMTEEEIAEFRRSYKLTSVESLRSLESVSEDANSQSGNSVDSRCRSCVRTSQESLMSLDSITEDCKCHSLSDKEQSAR